MEDEELFDIHKHKGIRKMEFIEIEDEAPKKEKVRATGSFLRSPAFKGRELGWLLCGGDMLSLGFSMAKLRANVKLFLKSNGTRLRRKSASRPTSSSATTWKRCTSGSSRFSRRESKSKS